MDDPTIPTAATVKPNNNFSDYDKIKKLNRNTAISPRVDKTDLVGEDYHCINKPFTATPPENVRVDLDSTACLSTNTIQTEASICSTSRNVSTLPKYENIAIENSFVPNESTLNLSMCKNKRNRKQFRTVRSCSDSTKDENITLIDSGEIKINNVCTKMIKNNQFHQFSDSLDRNNLTNSNTELISESCKTKEPTNISENTHTLNENDVDVLKSHKIETVEVSDSKSTIEKIIGQQKRESDDFETIDKIADMIASTGNVKNDVLPHKLDEYSNTEVCNNIENKIYNKNKCMESSSTKPSFEEVETRLEEMFAGIEDETVVDIDRPVSYLNNTGNSVKEDCQSSNNIAYNIVPNNEVYQNEISAEKGIYSGKNYPIKKRRKIVKKTFVLKANKPLEIKLKTKNVKEETISTDKYKGPYIQLNSEGLINVVNTPLSEEYSEKRSNIKKLILNYTKTERNKILGLHVSTLSTKYDADTTDTSWLCFFCKKGPHKSEQGDLFGPYIVSTNCEEYRMSQNHIQNVLEIQRVRTEMYQKDIHRFPIVPSILSNANKFRPDYKQQRKVDRDENTSKDNSEIFLGMVKVSDTSYEVWVHEDCIIWASGIYLIGSKIIGLESAVWRSTRNICSICSTNGAIVCCLQRECKEMAHIACAKSEYWIVSEHDFKAYCKTHSVPAR